MTTTIGRCSLRRTRSSGNRDNFLYRLGANKTALLRSCCIGSALLFCLAVGLKLSGSSVGMWRNLLAEAAIDRGLILSSPKHFRVDEWGSWTPAMLSQRRHNPPFPRENPSPDAGRLPGHQTVAGP